VTDADDISGVGRGVPHESAHLHVTGEAHYLDDLPEPKGTLYAAIGTSERAYARLRHLDLRAVLDAPGVVTLLAAADVPGSNNHGSVVHDDPIFADDVVEYFGQSIFAVVATSVAAARRAARLAVIDYEDYEPIIDIDTALQRQSFLSPSATLSRGDWARAASSAPHRLVGSFRTGGQEHFYLEGQIALAIPGEDGQMLIHSSTQHPTEVQTLVAGALGRQAKDVVVECRRLGGGFGGKETQATLFACVAALAARKTGRPVKLRVDRGDDLRITGKRHDYRIDYDVGFDDAGAILGVNLSFASRCGRSADLSAAINDRTMFHADNAYYLGDVQIVSHRLRTHTASNTAFRGFGGPQGMIGIENVLDDIARYLALDPLDVRRRNFYGRHGSRNTTPYEMKVDDNIIDELMSELESRSDYRARRRAIAEFNRGATHLKRGLAITPVKFGISFTQTPLNQAGALLHVYRDGTVMLNHGGTEMGQGLHTKVAQVVATELQIPIATIRCTPADTSKVPNTSATAASASSDLNGAAAAAAARTIRGRLCAFAAARFGGAADDVAFRRGQVYAGGETMSFAALVNEAYLARISLSATGFYRTPEIGYDRDTRKGTPFYYFAYGGAVTEVIIDTLTGESRLLQVDILHDVGQSLNPALDLGQIEGGFLQGVGWLTCEELWWDSDGRLRTDSTSTYKIPTATDWPEKFSVQLLSWGRNRKETIYRSKGVGEPPLMLALSTFFALKDAVGSLGEPGAPVHLDAPATPERILLAIETMRHQRRVSANEPLR
jgi:xanthine dehydrogenase large subunit